MTHIEQHLPWTYPEPSTTIGAFLLRFEADAWLVVPLAPRWIAFGEYLCPAYLRLLGIYNLFCCRRTVEI